MKRKQFYLPEKQIEMLEEASAKTGSSVSEVLRQQIQGLEKPAIAPILDIPIQNKDFNFIINSKQFFSKVYFLTVNELTFVF